MAFYRKDACARDLEVCLEAWGRGGGTLGLMFGILRYFMRIINEGLLSESEKKFLIKFV